MVYNKLMFIRIYFADLTSEPLQSKLASKSSFDSIDGAAPDNVIIPNVNDTPSDGRADNYCHQLVIGRRRCRDVTNTTIVKCEYSNWYYHSIVLIYT